jgi:hypothetical protein
MAVGDARAKGPVKSTTSATPAYTQKNARGQSFKTVTPRNKPGHSDGGGDMETASVAKRSTKGMRPGIGLSRDRAVEPFRDRNSAGQSFKTVGPRSNSSDSGAAIDAWCKGSRKTYR